MELEPKTRDGRQRKRQRVFFFLVITGLLKFDLFI